MSLFDSAQRLLPDILKEIMKGHIPLPDVKEDG